MKALLLTPLHESSEHIAMNLMVALGHGRLADLQDFEVLSVPNYADYLHSVGLAPSFEASVFMALSTVRDFADAHKNCIIIGNCDKSVAFDVILGININHEEGVKLPDLQVQKLKELYGNDMDLGPIINNLYCSDDAEYSAGGTVEQIVKLVEDLCQAKLN